MHTYIHMYVCIKCFILYNNYAFYQGTYTLALYEYNNDNSGGSGVVFFPNDP